MDAGAGGYCYSHWESSSNEEQHQDEDDSPAAVTTAHRLNDRSCGKGHRPSLLLETAEGGRICLVCFSNLISDPCSPSHHVSYALSQVSQAIRGTPAFLRDLRARHSDLVVSPLVQALSSSDDESLARQAIDLVSDLCFFRSNDNASDSAVAGANCLARGFIARIADRLSSGALAWSRRQIYTLHCLGILLNRSRDIDTYTCIKDGPTLVSNLVTGLQLPSEEIRGEILFVLYKLSILHDPSLWVRDADDDAFSPTGVKLLLLALEALHKTQNDEVRTNCIALLTVLAQRGFFETQFTNDEAGSRLLESDSLMQTKPTLSTVSLFADAIKGPLLSSDTQVQIGTLDLILHCLSSEISSINQIQVLVEENIADYVFEILRLSENRDPLIVSCLRVLDLLAAAEEAFKQRLVLGFPTLLSVLHYVAEIPLHPVQPHALKLVLSCISNCPGMISIYQVEELAIFLTKMFRNYTTGELGMLSETFILACTTYVEMLKSPSSGHILKLTALTQEVVKDAVLSALSANGNTCPVLLYSLYLLKEAYTYSQQETSHTSSGGKELTNCILEICETHLLPWLGGVIHREEGEDTILAVLETFHLILLHESDVQTRMFAEVLASSSWFSWSFGCLGFFPSDRMKRSVYLMLSSVIDCVLGQDFGQPIRDAYLYLPSDPLELIFLLGQKSFNDPDLKSTQSAILVMLYVSSLFSERFAEENHVLASLEEYILANGSDISCEISDSRILTQLVHLYGFLRAKQTSHGVPYSPEAEKLVFHLIAENDWDLVSIGIHPRALVWLFQQDRIKIPLSTQILNFCRYYSTNKSNISAHATNIQMIDIQILADLVDSENNCLTSLLVFLLRQMQDKGQEDDTIFVLNVIQSIINISPGASNQFCLQSIGYAICSIYCSHSSTHLFTSCTLLVFNVLCFANPETISTDGSWLQVTVKLLEHLTNNLADNKFSQDGLLILGILSMILHHSTHQALREASKTILLNPPLVKAIDTIVQAACAKGPTLIDQNVETNNEESLIFILLLYFFSLRSLHDLLQETLDWQDFMQFSKEKQPYSVINIKCHDLCRLIHFGSSSVKLVASQCLLELITRISDQRNRTQDELRCSARYLQSMMAVTEGLVFYGDSIIATNCGVSLSMILGWEKLGFEKNKAIKGSKWCRLVIEELALSMAAPSLASSSFRSQHKPAAQIAVALLKLNQVPGWMRTVFDNSCISGIVDSLSAINVSAEMVELFRELIVHDYLSKEQIARLHHVLQVCRKNLYKGTSKQHDSEEYLEKMVFLPDDIGKVYRVLIHLMLSTTTNFSRIAADHSRLLNEIETFLQENTKRQC